MAAVLWVAFGGAAGSVIRYLISDALNRRDAPWGTIVVNLVRSLALGVVIGWFARRNADSLVRVALGAGFLGGFTTFSAWAVETVALTDDGLIGRALANVFISMVAAILLAGVGLAIGRSI